MHIECVSTTSYYIATISVPWSKNLSTDEVEIFIIIFYVFLGYLPMSVMMPPNRLQTLLTQAVEYQQSKCIFHNSSEPATISSYSLLMDYHKLDGLARYTTINTTINWLIANIIILLNAMSSRNSWSFIRWPTKKLTDS